MLEYEIAIIRKKIIIDKVTKPSRPSIKLIILIIAVLRNIRKRVYKMLTVLDKSILFRRDKIKMEVTTWKPYLIVDLSPTLSSIIPVMANGKETNGMKYPTKLEKNTVEITKEIPPEVGVGKLCELLLFGESKKEYLKLFINNLIIKSVNKKGKII